MKSTTDLTLEFCHPQATEEPVFAFISVDWTLENDTYDTPGSFNWDYVEQDYTDGDGNSIPRPSWLDDETLEKEIQREIEFLDLGN